MGSDWHPEQRYLQNKETTERAQLVDCGSNREGTRLVIVKDQSSHLVYPIISIK